MKATAENLLIWMKSRGPDDWHRVATSWNWDGGYEVLTWIAEQPDCDLRTAQFMFQYGDPKYFLKFSDRVAARADINIKNFDFMVALVARAHQGQYKIVQFVDDFVDGYDRFVTAYLSEEARHRSKGIPWEMPTAFRTVARGPSRLSTTGFIEGYPPVFGLS